MTSHSDIPHFRNLIIAFVLQSRYFALLSIKKQNKTQRYEVIIGNRGQQVKAHQFIKPGQLFSQTNRVRQQADTQRTLLVQTPVYPACYWCLPPAESPLGSTLWSSCGSDLKCPDLINATNRTRSQISCLCNGHGLGLAPADASRPSALLPQTLSLLFLKKKSFRVN